MIFSLPDSGARPSGLLFLFFLLFLLFLLRARFSGANAKPYECIRIRPAADSAGRLVLWGAAVGPVSHLAISL